MRPILSTLYRLVRDEPRVSPVSPVLLGFFPPADVALVLVRYPYCQLVQFCLAGLCEMENVLVAVVEKALACDGLEVAYRNVAGNPGIVACVCLAYRNRLDPCYHVLQGKVPAHDRGDVPRYPLVLRPVADIEKERAVVGKRPLDCDSDLLHPSEVLFAGQGIAVRVVADPDVVRRRR